MKRRLSADAQAFEEAWQDRARRAEPVPDSEIAALVASAEQLCRAAVIEPTGEFRASLRTQLMVEATTALAPAAAPARTTRRHGRRTRFGTPSFAIRRRLAGATAAFVGAAGFVGMVGVSAEALPGEMLYPVKRGVENIELAFHNDDSSRGQYRLAQASERLAEARRLTNDNSPQARDQVAGVLDDFSAQAKDGSGAMFRVFDRNRSDEPITVVNDFSAAAAADLAILSSQVPSSAGDSFQNAADTVSQLLTTASTLCASCGTADIPGLTGAISSLTGAGSDQTSTEEEATSSNDGAGASVTEPDLDVPDLPLGQSPDPSASAPDAPTIKQLTEPTVTALLGDEEQPGLVGGLIDGLSGGGQK